MRFSAYEGGCTRISAQNKGDEKLLKKIADRIPKDQKGIGCNQWSPSGGSYLYVLEVILRNMNLEAVSRKVPKRDNK